VRSLWNIVTEVSRSNDSGYVFKKSCCLVRAFEEIFALVSAII